MEMYPERFFRSTTRIFNCQTLSQPSSTISWFTQLSMDFSKFMDQLKPFGEQVSRGLNQASQLAKEKLGTTSVEITEMPKEYTDLEDKVDKVKAFYENMVKVRYDLINQVKHLRYHTMITTRQPWTPSMTLLVWYPLRCKIQSLV